MLVALPNAFGAAATNMAIDAALLECAPEGLAVVRHYGWIEPSVTFGYAQNYADVAAAMAQSSGGDPTAQPPSNSNVTLCRRLTGGGIVDHRNDWTYAFILNASLPTAAMPATEAYEKIHRAISHTLQAHAQPIETYLAPCPKSCDEARPEAGGPSQCFVTPTANDVLRHDGRKIAGAAMKRNRYGLLIQGSIDREALPSQFDFITFQTIFIEQLAAFFDLPITELEDIRPLFKSSVIEREKERFSRVDWNQKR